MINATTIKDLSDQAKKQVPHGLGVDKWIEVYNEKFAELIVGECVGLCDKAAEENARTFYTVTETQEVGPALVSKGSQVQAEKLSRQIKQHFGVEE
jgi:hypothetical protein